MKTVCEYTMSCGPSEALRLAADEVTSWLRRLFSLGGLFPRADARLGSTLTPRLAASALLLEVAYADGGLSADELGYMESALSREFGLDRIDVERLLRSADAARKDATDAGRFTGEIVENLSERQRALLSRIIEGLAHIAGGPTKEQAYTVRKISNLLRVEPEYEHV